MVKYGFQNIQIAQELVFTKGLFFAESFFAYNYVLAKPEGPVRRICGAREVVLVFFLNPFKFHLYFWGRIINKNEFLWNKKREKCKSFLLQLWLYPGMQQLRFIAEAPIVWESLHQPTPAADG